MIIQSKAFLEILNDGEQLTKIGFEFPESINTKNLKTSDFQLTVNKQSIEISDLKFVNSLDSLKPTKESQCILIELKKNTALSNLVFNIKDFVNHIRNLNIEIHSNNNQLNNAYFDLAYVKEDFLNHFEHRIFENKNTFMNYYIYPGKQRESMKPLVIFLHGSGERGNGEGLPLLASDIVKTIYNYVQENEDAVILSPQASWEPALNGWFRKNVKVIVVELIRYVIAHYNIDPKRVYITGVSNGGAGTWNLIQNNPDLFAAAVPICGYIYNDGKEFEKIGNARYMAATDKEAETLKDMPVWAFHANDDPVVSVEGSRSAVSQLKKAGNTRVKYTEISAGIVKPNPHASWELAYDEPKLLPWLFSQKNRKEQ